MEPAVAMGRQFPEPARMVLEKVHGPAIQIDRKRPLHSDWQCLHAGTTAQTDRGRKLRFGYEKFRTVVAGCPCHNGSFGRVCSSVPICG